MSQKKGSSGQRRAVRTPRPASRSTPRPGRVTPSKGTGLAPDVDRHARQIAQRSTTNPAVWAIVGIGLVGLGAIIIYTIATTQTAAPPPEALAGRPTTSPPPVAAPPGTAAVPAVAPPAAMVAAPQPAAKAPRAPRIKLQGSITDEGRDDRTLAIACGSCGAALEKGVKTCPSCSTPVAWPDEMTCPYCFEGRGGGVCAQCRGDEPKRMMGIVFTCPSCDGSKKCRRCAGTGKLTF